MAHTAADILVDVLHDWGVRVVFGLPGDGINGIMEALRLRREKIRFIQVRHEESAAFMACAYAKYTGKLGVCLATSGPGGLHLLTGLYDAHFWMVLSTNPEVCHAGYESTGRRPPQDGENRPMNSGAHCAEPPTQSNARGAQNAPQRAPVAWYDGSDLHWGTRLPRDLSSPGSLAPRTLGGDSWKWLFLQPLMTSRE